MQSNQQFCSLLSRTISRAAVAALAMATVFALTVVLTQSAQAQTYKVLHNFTGGVDGWSPSAGVTLDAAGNLYGTTQYGGADGEGNVFELKPGNGNWVLNNLVSFNNYNGYEPYSGVVFGPDGALYGTTYEGGSREDGVVYSLRPPATACKTSLCPWTATSLYTFTGGSGDGEYPGYGNLTFDQAGNLYGTTMYGGPLGQGTVFKLAPSNGGWTESVLHTFPSQQYDGSVPYSGVIFDEAGNLYGTTYGGGSGCGGYGCGTVYQLTPSGSGWKENILYTFQNGTDGANPWGGLIFDPSGNLYGTAAWGGSGNGGTVFELSPASGGWTFTLLYSFSGDGVFPGPEASLAMDYTGSLYGTTLRGGADDAGTVFKLAPSNGSWIYTSLHDFTGNDGIALRSSVTWDASGNLYGTAGGGGTYGYGVVWEITP